MTIYVASLGHMRGGGLTFYQLTIEHIILGTLEKFVLSKLNHTLFQTKRIGTYKVILSNKN